MATQKHSHMPHARSSDPDLYYKIVLFALFGYAAKGIADLAGGAPIQTINRNLKIIRAKLTYNENYLTEVHNRFYHADPITGNYQGQWGMILRSIKPPKNAPLTGEQLGKTEHLVKCLKECPMGKSPKQFIQEHVELHLVNSNTFPEQFDPRHYPYPMVVPIMRDINGYGLYLKNKRSCGSCKLHKPEREKIFTIFAQSPYTYTDVAFQLTQFQPKKLEDYNDHLHFAWIAGCMRGIHHMKANQTALKHLTFEDQLRFSNNILLDFVNLTYDAVAGKVLPSLPFSG
jgi:hypothetical protein